MMTESTLIMMIIFGSIGTGYFIYGKKQKHTAALLCGIGLIALPYIIKNVWGMLALGILLSLSPFIIKKYF